MRFSTSLIDDLVTTNPKVVIEYLKVKHENFDQITEDMITEVISNI